MRITHSVFRRTWQPLPRSRQTHLRSNIWLAKARESIRLDLNRLLRESRKDGMWFWNRSLNIWLSPSKAKILWDSNHYLWGASHWTLRDPKQYGQG